MEVKSEVITIRELAKDYHCGLSTLYLWAQQGRFPTIRLGRKVLVRRSAFERFLDAHEQGEGMLVATISQDEWVTTGIAAKQLRTTRQSIHNWVRRGLLDVVQTPAGLLVSVASVEKMRAEQAMRAERAARVARKADTVL